MTLLRRHLAPIEQGVWDFIDEEARDVLKQKLSGRKVVDTLGPKGRDFAAYNTGKSVKLDINAEDAVYTMRNVLPIVEVEVPFELSLDEIEAYLRGAKDADIDNLVDAAKKVAKIENNALYYGLKDAGIEGLANISDNVKIEVSEETGFLTPITSAIQAFKLESVEGPYNFVVGPYLFGLLHKLDEKGYPLKKKIKDLIGGEIIFSEELGDQGLLLGTREDDFELIIGEDISIGFKAEKDNKLEFFFRESFTFKVNAPEAVVVFEKM